MQVIKIELRKILINQNGLVFIGMFLLLKTLSLFLFDQPVNTDMQLERQYYNHYLQQLRGKLTEERKEYFLQEQKRLLDADSAFQKLNHSYYEGEVERKEYEERLEELQQTLAYEKGFHVIYEQFIYSMEQPEQRYIMYTNGWEGLMAREDIDWLFILFLLLLITPVFCEEISSGMDTIILTEVRGGRNCAKSKLLSSVTIAALASVSNSLMEYVFFLYKYGMNNGSFPLQSLKFFESSSKEVSILGAFLGMSLLRLFGSVFFTTVLLFLSMIMRRYSLVLLSATTILMIPYSIFSLQSTKYMIPAPLGFLLSTGYYRGDQYGTDPLTGRTRRMFQEIPDMSLLILILIVTAMILGMIYIVLVKNTNILYKKKITRQER